MQGLTIRPMRADDIDAIWQITWRGWDGMTFRELLHRKYGWQEPDYWRQAKADEVAAQCRNAPDLVLVAELDGRVVGYATYHYRSDERWGVVGNNCVDPDYRGRGIGTALIAAVIERLKALGSTIITVTTLEHDLPARRVYEKNGFEELTRSVMYSMRIEPCEQ